VGLKRPGGGDSLLRGRSAGGGGSGVHSGADIVSRRWLYGMDRAGSNLRPCGILKRYTGNDGECGTRPGS